MFNEEERDGFERTAQEYIINLYNQLADWKGNTITYTIPDDEYSHWDMTATIDGVEYKVENKTRPNYHYYDFDTYYINAKKADLDLFNMIFPMDNVVAVTNQKTLKEFSPELCKVNRLKYCDNESPEGMVNNLVIPRNRWWIYQLKPFKIISKPKKDER